ncbi:MULTISPECIES: LPS export ABC transporter periplasmic protein LptC [Xenorhabdus]|uniref:Lipopolysaccharide export system protein LptC n=1 Tax=Xenorhabdus doucetiae TaxID=351671 RepID=A0A068QZH6_9GAMM|nr:MULTISPECIES: LPS export ABC transporter periplasmic protein LptC [Xenorhabdus]MBD2783894.1 LPS export ABC transporter periplasmic protein LptC [Xenorhabdus sp. 3]MBD2788550.1 LPS export ABC transporter periplasmic protein LptC [Xenorhabdus sp. DI]MDC9580394.1 LPS export ABC transporter periplasmic protein LptC [Xenorhabdus sp. PR6a]TYP09169.1 lipopolysaccharide export system protein LptC [Xenorhabdus doucetiae]CDG19215.1 Lipopolysaccharide export system protein lptC [Xenorhabdus doucetiae]
MSKIQSWLITILALIALALIGWNLSNVNDDTSSAIVDDGYPTYQTQEAVTFVYDPAGKLTYKLVADDVKNYTETKLTWFTNPVLTTFDPNGAPGTPIATWTVRANKAKLTHDQMLYLYGDVQVDSLTDASQLQRITTDNATVNLTTQDVASDDRVTLIGVGLKSVGMKMRGNLRNKTAELIEKVTTQYEIPHEQPNP